MRPVITFTTDFGLADPYVGTMHGVVTGICPEAHLIDITHGVPAFNVLAGALALSGAYRYFPPATVHVAVVDPGVGSARKPVLVAAAGQFFLAPDNGLLTPILEAEGPFTAIDITSPQVILPAPSSTFHGRDVFAPAAAHLANQLQAEHVDLCHFGPPMQQELTLLPFPRVKHLSGGIAGAVLHVDHFGNCITNLREGDLAKLRSSRQLRITFSADPPAKPRAMTVVFASHYAAVSDGELLGLIGSSGLLEFAVNGGSAVQRLQLGSGATFTVHPA